jgi:hypothetical protein
MSKSISSVVAGECKPSSEAKERQQAFLALLLGRQLAKDIV